MIERRACGVLAALLLSGGGVARGAPSSAASAPERPESRPTEVLPASPREPAPEHVVASASDGEPEPHHVRTLQQMAFGLGGFALGYWLLGATQRADWDYPSVMGRFDGSAWRYDNNQLIINYWLHPMAGAEMYAIARANHHAPWTAAAYSTLSSFLWEFVFEYRELVSVNDLLATSIPGVPVGEFMHQLGLYLNGVERPGLVRRAAQWALHPGLAHDRWLDARLAPEAPLPWHDFELGASFGSGQRRGEREHVVSGARFHGELVSLRGYGQPVALDKTFHEADITSLELGVEASQHGPGILLSAETLLLGHHRQDAQRSWTLGLPLAYTYLESHAHGFAELLGAVHLLGLRVQGQARSPVAQVEAGLRLSPDFVGVGAYGYDEWHAAHPGELGKHILRNQGYYYGWGGSGLFETKLAVGPLRFDGSLFFGRYRSQEGLNRWQERITIDVPAGTDLLQYRAGLSVRLGRLPVRAGAGAVLRRWNTFIGEVRKTEQSLARGVEVHVDF